MRIVRRPHIALAPLLCLVIGAGVVAPVAADPADPAPSASASPSASGRVSVALDPETATVRTAMRTHGTLTEPSRRAAVDVATSYVADHLADLGLATEDLDTLRLAREYVDVEGTHHLFWTQHVAGQVVENGGLRAAVTEDGRLLMVTGSPISGLRPPAVAAQRITSADAALSTARGVAPNGVRRARPAPPAPGDRAERVLHADPDGTTHPAWEVLLAGGDDAGLSLVDAVSGSLLGYDSLTASEAAATPPQRDPESPAIYFPYYPNAPLAPDQIPVDLTEQGWLSAGATRLSGNNVHAWADVDADREADPREEVGPSSGHSWAYPFTAFDLPEVSFCDNPIPCAWDPSTPYSWRTNRKQNTTQVFATVNLFHDHLLAEPIGFTEAAGNFERVNSLQDGNGGDAVQALALHGANSDRRGLPYADTTNNATMYTPPDGEAPVMRLFLNHIPGKSYPKGDGFAPTNGGDGADTIYHEYTHGLSHRLVVNSRGNSTLGSQGDAMGEGWSDWYAMDFLVAEGLQADDPAVADLRLFQNDSNLPRLERTGPIDCRVDDPSPACRGGKTGHTGGYTLADYAQIVGYAQPHADGELWAQTLWDIRRVLGSELAQSLITRAMELSPNNPSFLDMRNAILLADTAHQAGAHIDTLWDIFAARGMGYLSGFATGQDERPVADFSVPADHPATGFLTGTVRDLDSGRGIEGATVRLSLEAPGYHRPTVTTDARGRFRLGPVPLADYPRATITAPTYYDTRAGIGAGPVAGNVVALRRDWALKRLGSSVEATGPTKRYARPRSAVDDNDYTAWLGATGQGKKYRPRSLTVRLGKTISLRAIGVSRNVRERDRRTSLRHFKLLASKDGRSWKSLGRREVEQGRPDAVTLFPVKHVRARYVRIVLLSNQLRRYRATCDDGSRMACRLTGLTSLQIFGKPKNG